VTAPPKFSNPLVVIPSKKPLFVNVELIVRVPPIEIRPELVTGLDIVTMWLTNLSSPTPGTPGSFTPSRQVAAEFQSPF